MPAHAAHDDQLLRIIAEGTASAIGDDFLHSLVRHVVQALGVNFCFVAEFLGGTDQLRTHAYWRRGEFVPNLSWSVTGTPCEQVRQGEMKFFPSRVARQFEHDRALATLGIESYLAIPMLDADRAVLGHLAIMDDKPMTGRERDFAVLKIFAARAGAELLRIRAADALKKNEQRLASILGSAMDAIIAFDDARHITLFNTAAERIFRCARDWALGQPFDRFLSKRFRSLLDGYLQSTSNPDTRCVQLWAPEGLTAQRACGEEFPIEATLSPLDLDGARLYTVILRDVNERKRVETELANLKAYAAYLAEEAGCAGTTGLLGDSPALRALIDTLKTVAGTDTTVLVQGETGTGKELIAHALHTHSRRADKPLVKLNCAALPAELIESELFGHEKGAFTGATAQRQGRFELADGGTLFLDEVGELTQSAQAKLLRVLQDRSFERVGGARTLSVDVRVIAATNRNLAARVEAGEFRADLYYRLAVFPIDVPSLRERGEDVVLLARHFLARCARKLGKAITDFTPAALQRLRRYDWPGNVRELANIVERAALLAKGPLVDDVGVPERHAVAPAAGADGSMAEVQRAHIVRVLESCHWRIEGPGGGAARLGMEPSTLRYRMQKLGIRRPRRD